MLPLYSNVELITDRYSELGVKNGDKGVVIEVYDEKGYEIEFMDDDGNTLNCFGVEPNEVNVVGD